MANTFSRVCVKLTSTTDTSIYTVPSLTTTILKSLYCSNITNTETQVSVYIYDGSTAYYLIKEAAVPNTTTLQIVTEPIVLAFGDSLYVKAETANAIDVVGSHMEIT